MNYERKQVVDEQAVNKARNDIKDFFSRIGRASFYNYAIHDIEEPRTGYFNLAGNNKELRLGLIGDKDRNGKTYTEEQLNALDTEFIKLIQKMQRAQGYVNEMSNDIRTTEARAIGDFFSRTEQKDELYDFFTELGKEDSYRRAVEYIENPSNSYFNLAGDNKKLRLEIIGETDVKGNRYTEEQLNDLDAKFVNIIKKIQKEQNYTNNASKDSRNSEKITGTSLVEEQVTNDKQNEFDGVDFGKYDTTVDGFKQFCIDYNIDKSAAKLVIDCLSEGRSVMPEQFDSLSSSKIIRATINSEVSLTGEEIKLLVNTYYEDLENYLNAIAGKKIVERINDADIKLPEPEANEKDNTSIVNQMINDIEEKEIPNPVLKPDEKKDEKVNEVDSSIINDNDQFEKTDESENLAEEALSELTPKDKDGKEIIYLKEGKIDNNSIVKILSSKPLKIDQKHYKKLAKFIPGIRGKLKDIEKLEIEKAKALGVSNLKASLNSNDIELDDKAKDLIDEQAKALEEIKKQQEKLEKKIGVKIANKFLLKNKKNKQAGSKPSKTTSESVKAMNDFISNNYEFVEKSTEDIDQLNITPFDTEREKIEKKINSAKEDIEYNRTVYERHKKNPNKSSVRVMKELEDAIKKAQDDLASAEEELINYDKQREDLDSSSVDSEIESDERADDILSIKDKIMEEQSKKINKLESLYDNQKKQNGLLIGALKKVGNFTDEELETVLEQYKTAQELESTLKR